MLANNVREIAGLVPREPSVSLKNSLYGKPVYNHISNLFSFKYRSNEIKVGNLILNKNFYSGMSHLAFENSSLVEFEEPSEIDWENVETKTENFIDRISESFKQADASEINELYLNSTRDMVENFYAYEYMHPNSIFNPWLPVVQIYRNGLLLRYEDDPYLVKQLSSSKKSEIEYRDMSVLKFLVKGKKKNSGSLFVDDRFHFQTILLDFLKKKKATSRKPVSIGTMQSYFEQIGYELKYDYIQINFTTPLKKTGLIGSSSDGFFLITNKEDLIASYCFHYHKDESIAQILKKYESISKKFGVDDLSREC